MANAAEISLDRMVRAVERVRERLVRSTGALERAGISYAVVGGNAVGAWVLTVDQAAVRNTRNVDILIERDSLEQVKAALEREGLLHRHIEGIDIFLDAPEGSAHDGVRLLFAGEVMRPEDPGANPRLEEVEEVSGLTVLSLNALVQTKLTAFRRTDRVHLRDMIEVGLIDESWEARFPSALAGRLRQMLDDPHG